MRTLHYKMTHSNPIHKEKGMKQRNSITIVQKKLFQDIEDAFLGKDGSDSPTDVSITEGDDEEEMEEEEEEAMEDD